MYVPPHGNGYDDTPYDAYRYDILDNCSWMRILTHGASLRDVTGRWAAKDPIFFKSGQPNLFVYVDSVGKASDGMNLYQYAGGNPVNYRDPYGLFTSPAGLAGELATGVGGILLLTGTAPTVGTVLLVGGVGLIAYDMISSMSDAQEQGNRLGKWYKKIMDDYYKKIDKIENKVCPINRMR